MGNQNDLIQHSGGSQEAFGDHFPLNCKARDGNGGLWEKTIDKEVKRGFVRARVGSRFGAPHGVS